MIEEGTLKNQEDFPIPFEVPFKSATRNLNGITSHTKFSEFLEAAAQRMETQLSLLASIAYVPSYKPKSPKPVPKLLEDNKDWETLLDDIDKYRVACMTKGTGKGTQKEAGIVKAFVIKIVDISVSDEKVSKKVSCISLISSTDCFEILWQTQGAKKAASESTQPASNSVQTEADLLRSLEKQHMCAACNRPCYVLSNGDHHPYSMQELSTWAYLLVYLFFLLI